MEKVVLQRVKLLKVYFFMHW